LGSGTSYDNNYLKPVPYNLQQIIYMTAIMQCNISINVNMYKQTIQKRLGKSNKETWYLLLKRRIVCKRNKGWGEVVTYMYMINQKRFVFQLFALNLRKTSTFLDFDDKILLFAMYVFTFRYNTFLTKKLILKSDIHLRFDSVYIRKYLFY
jgi:hypothetical protein